MKREWTYNGPQKAGRKAKELKLTQGQAQERQKVFDELIMPHVSGLKKYALHLTRDTLAAADLLQDTLLKAWVHLESFVGAPNVGGKLTLTMRNLFYNRKKAERNAHVPFSTYDPEYLEHLEAGVAEGASESYDHLHAAISRLPDEFRSAVELCYLQGFKAAEAAKILGVPENTVKTRLHRAKKHLRSLLEV